MTFYVESNFVLEIALGQEQSASAEAILERADLSLALSAFSLSEPFFYSDSTIAKHPKIAESNF